MAFELKILDTDQFYKDSPDAGDRDCICSRCHNKIAEHEVPLRVAIDQEILYAKDNNRQRKKAIN